jgi:uncharacterized protein YijF (DUF1287 family)
MTFFSRKGTVKAITKNPKDYVPGDIVCWSLGKSITHTGMVVNKKSKDGKRFFNRSQYRFWPNYRRLFV